MRATLSSALGSGNAPAWRWRRRRRPLVAIFGGIDATKFRSSMTLFAAAAPDEEVFRACLEAFFSGEPDPETLARI